MIQKNSQTTTDMNDQLVGVFCQMAFARLPKCGIRESNPNFTLVRTSCSDKSGATCTVVMMGLRSM
jgi:hypothetical protein|tara:strand:+ start:210 stop:407 length:198 start_codon:yes stop_codon:yes gene_type:complete